VAARRTGRCILRAPLPSRRHPSSVIARVTARAVAVAIVAIVAFVALAQSASAQSTPTTRLVSVRADGAESCPADEELRAAVGARLGYDAFAADADTETHVTWWRDARGKLASRVVRTGADGAALGERSLESGADACTELASATAFAIAVAIDPAAATREPGAVPAPAPPAPPAPVAPPAPPEPPPAPPPPPPAPARQSPVEPPASPSPTSSPAAGDLVFVPFIGASAHAAFLATPAVVPGGSIHLGFRVAFLSLTGEGRFDTEGRGADEGAAGEVGMTLSLGMLTPCAHLDPVAFCAVMGVGAIGAQGYGVDRPDTDGTVFGVVGPRVGAELPILGKRLGLFAQADALLGVPRATVELDGRPAFEPSPVHFTLGGGIRLHLGELSGLFDPPPPGKSSPEPVWR
jgi:hypothetical protein